MKISLVGDINTTLLPLFEAVSIACVQVEGIEKNLFLQLRICNDIEIQILNKEYRGKDSPTDVLSFPSLDYPDGTLKNNLGMLHEIYDDEMKAYFIGDSIISIDTAQRQADLYGHSLERELAFLFTHSILHLFGYDHQTLEQESVMREKQNIVMTYLGLEIKE